MVDMCGRGVFGFLDVYIADVQELLPNVNLSHHHSAKVFRVGTPLLCQPVSAALGDGR
jgi:hypothetical protein